MNKHTLLKGFSKLSDREKRHFTTLALADPAGAEQLMTSFMHPDQATQQTLSAFSENTLTNFPMPYGIAPNFLINDRVYMVPMVIEESSVVAAAASAAGYWAARGGFRAAVKDTQKTGQLHFTYAGNSGTLMQAAGDIEGFILNRVMPLTKNMVQRGGGIRSVVLADQRHIMKNYYQLQLGFDTADAMGANFINTILEECSSALFDFFDTTAGFDASAYEPLMAILSNYTPDCLVEVFVQCAVEELGEVGGMAATDFARRVVMAWQVADNDISRAVTHNKGIMNGVDAVVLATGNDFRAIEAGVHAYAARSGAYRSLSKAAISDDGVFSFSLALPLALGTVGGLTSLHPLATLSLQILGNPGARELMMIAAAAGLANNFAAIRSLVTTGIQAGHMRMHLPNILHSMQCSPQEVLEATAYFASRKVSYQAVTNYIELLRNEPRQGF